MPHRERRAERDSLLLPPRLGWRRQLQRRQLRQPKRREVPPLLRLLPMKLHCLGFAKEALRLQRHRQPTPPCQRPAEPPCLCTASSSHSRGSLASNHACSAKVKNSSQDLHCGGGFLKGQRQRAALTANSGTAPPAALRRLSSRQPTLCGVAQSSTLCSSSPRSRNEERGRREAT